MALHGAAYTSATRAAKKQMKNRAWRTSSGNIGPGGPGIPPIPTPETRRALPPARARRKVGRIIDGTSKSASLPTRGMTGRGLRQARTAGKKIRPGAASKLSKFGRNSAIVAAVAGVGTYAAYRSSQRSARDLNQTLGNPASNVTAWTTYNRTNRGY